MQKNVGRADAIIRYLLAALVAVLIFTHVLTGTLAVVLGILAAVLVFTGLIGWCGLYSIFGIRTCPKKS
ncbi:MAG TPA: DUF2892 domain-containing protein [Bacteroidales bacterium]|nr:DUF2892 domain-containing protein [Bacteroidales bacterium]